MLLRGLTQIFWATWAICPGHVFKSKAAAAGVGVFSRAYKTAFGQNASFCCTSLEPMRWCLPVVINGALATRKQFAAVAAWPVKLFDGHHL